MWFYRMILRMNISSLPPIGTQILHKVTRKVNTYMPMDHSFWYSYGMKRLKQKKLVSRVAGFLISKGQIST